jgi:hypothetical protein
MEQENGPHHFTADDEDAFAHECFFNPDTPHPQLA